MKSLKRLQIRVEKKGLLFPEKAGNSVTAFRNVRNGNLQINLTHSLIRMGTKDIYIPIGIKDRDTCDLLRFIVRKVKETIEYPF